MISSEESRIKQIKLAKAIWRWKPHPTQREWLQANAQVKVAACGRRWGKTEAAAVDIASFAILFPGSRQMVVSPSYDQSRIIAQTIEKLMGGSGKLSKYMSVTRSPYTRIKIAQSLISARTADDDGRNLRGQGADRIIVDEAAYVRDTVVDEVIAPMLADKNGELILVSTPFGRNHFYRAYTRGQKGGSECVSMNFPSTSNPHISGKYIEQQREIISELQYAVEYEARFVEEHNSVLKSAEIERALAGNAKGSGEWVVAGIDWARYSDYTAMVAIDNGEAIAVERINNLPWKTQIERVTEFIQRNKVNAVLADQTSIGDPLNEQLREELTKQGCDVLVAGMVFTNTSKRELIENLAVAIARGMITIPNDTNLVSELRYYEYELSEHGNVKLGAKRGFHDDLVTALALAWKGCTSASQSNILLSGNKRRYEA